MSSTLDEAAQDFAARAAGHVFSDDADAELMLEATEIIVQMRIKMADQAEGLRMAREMVTRLRAEREAKSGRAAA